FFQQQQSLRKLLKGRSSVHDVADQVINKRQRIELEDELRSHDEKDHAGKDVASQRRDNRKSTNSHEDSRCIDNSNNIDDDGNDGILISIPRTPPRSNQRYFEEVPQVKDLEAVFHHATELNNFKLSVINQDLYNEATVWFQSNNGRDAETVIQNIRNDPFWEPWINDLLYDRLTTMSAGASSTFVTPDVSLYDNVGNVTALHSNTAQIPHFS
ncbi:hypothetical protein BX616_007261, partial [Lobosporangium transversale]